MRRIIALMFFCSFCFPKAHAAIFYFEVGPGLSMINNAASVFGGGFTSGGLAFSTNAILAFQTGGSFEPTNFHLGVRGQYLSGLNNSTYGNLLGLYPMVRIEFYRFYIGAGIAPLAFTRISTTSPGIDSLRPITGSLPIYGEVGLEWKMVPDFHLNLNGTLHTTTTFAMLPSYEFSVQFRFLFNIGGKSVSSSSGGSSRSAGKYDGWRYPFGIGKK